MKGFSELRQQLATAANFYREVCRELNDEDDGDLKEMSRVFQHLAERLDGFHTTVSALEDMCYVDITHARTRIARLGGYIEDVTRPWDL